VPETVPVDLDDPGTFAAVDTADALADVERTAEQWAHARDLTGDLRLDLAGVTAVLVPGMGGSGVSGDVIGAIAGEGLDVPIVVQKGYGVPSWVGQRTLVLAASYSGDTEETLSSVEESLARGARLLAVTAGGALGEIAAAGGHALITVPGGRQPRHSLGYLAVPMLVALGLADGLSEAIEVLDGLAGDLDRKLPTDRHAAKALAARLAGGSVPVIYGTQGTAAIAALRLACQLNENAKLPAFHGTMPEICHNAIVGWEGPSELVGRSGLIWLRDPTSEHPRNGVRATLVAGMLEPRVSWQTTLSARGRSVLARLASLLLQADLISVYAGLARGIDPTPIASIERLKTDLGRSGA
jgi:glucose/mannose-6-phosphate isomerase